MELDMLQVGGEERKAALFQASTHQGVGTLRGGSTHREPHLRATAARAHAPPPACPLQRLDYRARVDVPELCAALRDACVRATSPCGLPPPPLEPAEMLAADAVAAAAQARAAVATASALLQDAEGDAADADSCCAAATGELFGGQTSRSEDATMSEVTTEAAVGAVAAGSAWWDAPDATSRVTNVPGPDRGCGSPRLPLCRWPSSFEKRRGCSVEAAATAASGQAEAAEHECVARRQVAVDV